MSALLWKAGEFMGDDWAIEPLDAKKKKALENLHQLLLEALRHREQEIFRYLAILGPALGGFIWLLYVGGSADVTRQSDSISETTHYISSGVYIIGTISVLLLLLLGAIYSLALGYNYRYITFQLAKLEKKLGIESYMLKGWPRCPQKFLDRYKIFCCKPWCAPPEVIKVFWLAFLVGIIGVTVASCFYRLEALILLFVIPLGFCFIYLAGWYAPRWYGDKLWERCKDEMKNKSRDGTAEG